MTKRKTGQTDDTMTKRKTGQTDKQNEFQSWDFGTSVPFLTMYPSL